ncbi:hypothetical protein ILUMI_15862 [Ignelater luminosus]|uniref:Uncharacterized protein n=1 Tax=Ignelater luminosus TaxID=2038154 RepID=A0A8K0G941_IGNLU|nr:hypothetical protein ILUMI_15862 [Ignelater luminosus]
MNFQVVVRFVAIDAFGEIKEVANRPPRRFQHDTYIWRNYAIQSIIENIYQKNRKNLFYFSGDSDYLLRPRLLTPPQEEPASESSQERYSR